MPLYNTYGRGVPPKQPVYQAKDMNDFMYRTKMYNDSLALYKDSQLKKSLINKYGSQENIYIKGTDSEKQSYDKTFGNYEKISVQKPKSFKPIQNLPIGPMMTTAIFAKPTTKVLPPKPVTQTSTSLATPYTPPQQQKQQTSVSTTPEVVKKKEFSYNGKVEYANGVGEMNSDSLKKLYDYATQTNKPYPVKVNGKVVDVRTLYR